ncbi:hypothetical protein M2352_001216 [Azospirillum fermentarium]|uniref:hypothetical protein n=1 Tax=Azospirillum fermentarium TaxID=1233114 RepID=UPI002225E377|nr:hypothetical protein [Azospirillum fermentarium]MCW2245625.1 hypothetical protein [Azospirillum fermentarium]
MAPLPPLFLDLDGVLADFDRGVRAVTGRFPHEMSVRALWAAAGRHPDFFATLEFTPGGRDLWDFCAPHRPTILTGLPLGTWAAPQKRRWVAEKLGADVPVITCMARDKHCHAVAGAVLVDDREKARPPWEGAGGAFIRHTDAASTIAALRRMGF